jgi:hypothetical protein
LSSLLTAKGAGLRMLLIAFLWYGFFLLYFLFFVFSLLVVASASEMLKNKTS